jgi:beta-glucosidase
MFDYRVEAAPTGPVMVTMTSGANATAQMPIAGLLRAAPVGEWRTMVLPLRCFSRAGVAMNAVTSPFGIAATAPLTLSIAEVRLGSAPVNQDQCGAP